MSNKFKDVTELVDSEGVERIVNIKVTKKEVIRTSKNPKWEARIDLKKIEATGGEKDRFRKPNKVWITLKNNDEIEWTLKKGQTLTKAIEDNW